MTLSQRSVHDRALERAARAIDGPLSPAEAADLEGHIASCLACARRASAFRADAAALSLPLDLEPGHRVDQTIRAAIMRPDTGLGGRPGRSLLLVVAAALIVVALVSAMAVGGFFLRSLQRPPISVDPNPPPVAVVSPAPTTPPIEVGETWDAMDFQVGSDGLLEAITFDGTSLVGVGRGSCVVDSNASGSCHGAAWTAGPGEPLAGAPEQPGLEMGTGTAPSGPEKGIFDVVAGPAGLVAVGYDYNPPRSSCTIAPCTSGPAVWRSADGQTWERIPIDLGPGVIDRFSDPIAAIAAGPHGYIMVGFASDQGVPGPDVRARATAWTSPDGTTWTRAIDSAEMDVGPCVDTRETPSCGGMRAVAVTPSGFVAVGEVRTSSAPDQPPQPAAWTSLDGLRWTRVSDGLGFGAETVNVGGSLSGVTAGGPGLVAVGSACRPDCGSAYANGLVATSVDGSTWSLTILDAASELIDVTTSGRSLFAPGVRQSASGPAELQLWRSDDSGVTWQRVTGLPTTPDALGYRAVDIAATANRVVIAGWAEVTGGDTFRNFGFSSPAARST